MYYSISSHNEIRSYFFFFFSSRRRHTRYWRDWSSDVCSSDLGYGASSPEFNYPNRLAAQLRRKYPNAEITVINRGKGGEDAAEMMVRLQVEVIDMKPDLVIWQVGTNAVLRNIDPEETAKQVEDGVARIQ